MNSQISASNPLTRQDYPDPDVIRVGDTYYMISTTMHFMPGGVILRSYDLANWEIASYVYDTLDDTDAQRLQGDLNVYGKGMWAASLRWHKGMFYVCFVANDTHKTYLYRSEKIEGPWSKQEVKGFYHDCSLLFDDDDRVYIVYGNKEIHLTELTPELDGPKEGGLDRVIVEDKDHPSLGYEGAHLYKIDGRYYVFFIHSLRTEWFRTEACFSADSLEGEFTGGDVVVDDMGYRHAGVAQGGIVDTPDGEWYGILFQDRGGVGRIPVLVPMHWENRLPVFGGADGKIPLTFEVKSTRPGYVYEPLFASDDFNYEPEADGRIRLKKVWQWNHNPQDELWSVTERKGALRLHSGKISRTLTQAYNTLTQRTAEPVSSVTVLVDASGINEGDFAGITTFIGCYGAVAVTCRNGVYEAVMFAKSPDEPDAPEKEHERIALDGPRVRLKCSVDYRDGKDSAEFFAEKDDSWVKIGVSHHIVFRLDHFCGCRFGLFYQSTEKTGGYADFMEFKYHKGQNPELDPACRERDLD